MSDISQMIDDCKKRESRLSEWEQHFIDSISNQIGQGLALTGIQIEKLEAIWESATEDG